MDTRDPGRPPSGSIGATVAWWRRLRANVDFEYGGAANFEERNRGIFCYATPIRDAYGEPVAVLDVSAPAPAPRLSREAARWIAAHPWPGNVRELKSAVMHALVLCDAGSIGVEHLPRSLPAAPVRASAEPTTRREIVRDAIDAALGACAGNVSEAARRLGVGRGTIYRAVRDRKAE